jgi:hypothetical protein
MARRTQTYAIRLAVEGGSQVKAELVSVGQSGEQSLKRIESAGERASGGLKGLGRQTELLRTGIRTLGGALAGVATVGGLATLVDRSLSAADAIGETASKIGVGVEALQELRYAASLAGVEQQTLDMALQRLPPLGRRSTTGRSVRPRTKRVAHGLRRGLATRFDSRSPSRSALKVIHEPLPIAGNCSPITGIFLVIIVQIGGTRGPFAQRKEIPARAARSRLTSPRNFRQPNDNSRQTYGVRGAWRRRSARRTRAAPRSALARSCADQPAAMPTHDWPRLPDKAPGHARPAEKSANRMPWGLRLEARGDRDR